MRATAAVALFLLLTAGPAAAATLVVPGDYPSIQDAVNAASNGDTIQVAAGEWVGSIDVKSLNDLTLAGKKGAVIDGAGATECLYVDGCRNVTITGFTFEDAVGDAVRVVDSTGIAISRCTVSGSGMNGLYFSSCDRVEVVGCTIRSVGASGVRADAGCERVTVEKCVVEDTTAHGIALSFEGGGVGVSHAVIQKNTVHRAGHYGIVAGGSNLLIAKNTVVNADYRGIAIDDSTNTPNALITGNTVTDSAFEGIVLHWSGSAALKNRVEGSGAADLLVRGTDHLVEGNQISGGLAEGIYVEADGCEVLKNKLAGGTLCGVRVSGVGNTLTGNAASYLLVGFIADGTGNTFEKNKAKSCKTWDLVDSTGPGGNTYVDIDKQFPHRAIAPPP